MAFLQKIQGYKTYFAAAGLFGLALYQISVGQLDQAAHSILTALATAGLRNAIATQAA